MPGQTGLAPEDESCVHQWLVDAGAGAAVLFTHDPPNRLASLPPLLALTLSARLGSVFSHSQDSGRWETRLFSAESLTSGANFRLYGLSVVVSVKAYPANLKLEPKPIPDLTVFMCVINHIFSFLL